MVRYLGASCTPINDFLPVSRCLVLKREGGKVPGKQETSYAMSSDLGWVLVEDVTREKRRTFFYNIGT